MTKADQKRFSRIARKYINNRPLLRYMAELSCWRRLNMYPIPINGYTTDRAELTDMAQRYTLVEMGEEFELSYSAISLILKHHGICKPRVRRETA